MLVMGPHFVASAVRYLPSTLRERPIQGTLNQLTKLMLKLIELILESWIRFFAVIMKLMSHPIELSTELNSDEKTLIVTCSKQLLEIQKVLGPQMMQQKFQKVWSREAGELKQLYDTSSVTYFIPPLFFKRFCQVNTFSLHQRRCTTLLQKRSEVWTHEEKQLKVTSQTI